MDYFVLIPFDITIYIFSLLPFNENILFVSKLFNKIYKEAIKKYKTSIFLYNSVNDIINVEKWINIISNLKKELYNELIEGGIMESMNTIKKIRDNLPKDIHFTLEPAKEKGEDISGITIIGHIIWLIRDTEEVRELHSIKEDLIKAFDIIIDNGFDVNKTEIYKDNRKLYLITPIAELMRIDGIKISTSIMLLNKLKNVGADFEKYNVWNGSKMIHNYKSIYLEWANFPVEFEDFFE